MGGPGFTHQREMTKCLSRCPSGFSGWCPLATHLPSPANWKQEQVCVCSQEGEGPTCPGVDATRCGCVGLTCGGGCLVTEEPGLAAWDGLKVRILRGRRQGLGSGSQETGIVTEQAQPVQPDGEGEGEVTPLPPALEHLNYVESQGKRKNLKLAEKSIQQSVVKIAKETRCLGPETCPDHQQTEGPRGAKAIRPSELVQPLGTQKLGRSQHQQAAQMVTLMNCSQDNTQTSGCHRRAQAAGRSGWTGARTPGTGGLQEVQSVMQQGSPLPWGMTAQPLRPTPQITLEREYGQEL
ncbi:hypothetical protein Cadr_000029879 [Camelus dromedarius]|uniref:Uncharacterized protein n=1 Tax=Camelus dromedarius TaxID=9838 RepID=A0A5N4CCX8_CAMDR|nr:hypothetical protein Cadr_000029879 [Camelus dromedarius]